MTQPLPLPSPARSILHTLAPFIKQGPAVPRLHSPGVHAAVSPVVWWGTPRAREEEPPPEAGWGPGPRPSDLRGQALTSASTTRPGCSELHPTHPDARAASSATVLGQPGVAVRGRALPISLKEACRQPVPRRKFHTQCLPVGHCCSGLEGPANVSTSGTGREWLGCLRQGLLVPRAGWGWRHPLQSSFPPHPHQAVSSCPCSLPQFPHLICRHNSTSSWSCANQTQSRGVDRAVSRRLNYPEACGKPRWSS